MNINPEYAPGINNDEEESTEEFFRRVAAEIGFAALWETFIQSQPNYQLMTATMSAKQVLCDYQEQLFDAAEWTR